MPFSSAFSMVLWTPIKAWPAEPGLHKGPKQKIIKKNKNLALTKSNVRNVFF